MERLLIFIKHNFRFAWVTIEQINSVLFSLFYGRLLQGVLRNVIKEFARAPYTYRKLTELDSHALLNMINDQDSGDLEFFHPHDFDFTSIKRQLIKRSFAAMGAFDNDRLIGYFFLRFFLNRRCFVGRLIDKSYRKKGIGRIMNAIMYETAWRMRFRCLSTVSRNNYAVMQSHSRNPYMVILKKLDNDYLLIEFIKDDKARGLGD